MVNLAQLVDASLARHGVEAAFDAGRVQWSTWFCVDDRLGLLQVPGKPGLFALAEELAAPRQPEVGDGKRLLGLFQVAETEDLGSALGRLFLSSVQDRRGVGNRCFVRYAAIEDDRQRRSAYAAFQRWTSSQAEAGASFARSGPDLSTPEASPAPRSSNMQAQNGPPEAFSSGF
jgi:hypothetical protein